MAMRDEWLRRVRDAADEAILDGLRYDGQPLTQVERKAVKVLAGRLSWASLHWGTDAVDPDAWVALGVAFARAGWRPPFGPSGRRTEALRCAFMAGTEAVRPDAFDPSTPEDIEEAWSDYERQAAEGGADDE